MKVLAALLTIALVGAAAAWAKTGSFTYDDGSTYEGEFEDGKVHGQGTYTWAGGRMYEGAFESGLPHGEGLAQRRVV